jgi:hypothetical protein
MRGNTGIVLALKKTAISFAKLKSGNISALISPVRLGHCPRGTIGGRAPLQLLAMAASTLLLFLWRATENE